ncbi:MAG: hypothetical protein ACSW8A_11245 [Lachnospiraceae bacterium]
MRNIKFRLLAAGAVTAASLMAVVAAEMAKRLVKMDKKIRLRKAGSEAEPVDYTLQEDIFEEDDFDTEMEADSVRE